MKAQAKEEKARKMVRGREGGGRERGREGEREGERLREGGRKLGWEGGTDIYEGTEVDGVRQFLGSLLVSYGQLLLLLLLLLLFSPPPPPPPCWGSG